MQTLISFTIDISKHNDLLIAVLNCFFILCIYLSISTYLYLSIYIYLYLSISIYLYLSIYIYLYLSIYIYLYLSIYLYLYLSISIYLYLSISIYLYLSIFLSSSFLLPFFFLSPSDPTPTQTPHPPPYQPQAGLIGILGWWSSGGVSCRGGIMGCRKAGRRAEGSERAPERAVQLGAKRARWQKLFFGQEKCRKRVGLKNIQNATTNKINI